MASLTPLLRSLGAAFLLGVLPACGASGTSSNPPPKAATTPVGNLPASVPVPVVSGSTGAGDVPGSAGTIGVPPSSGSGGR